MRGLVGVAGAGHVKHDVINALAVVIHFDVFQYTFIVPLPQWVSPP
jgi:hypothetical protein